MLNRTALFLLLITPLPGLRSQDNKIDMLYDSAKQYQLQGKLVKARNILEKYLPTTQAQGDAARSYTLLGVVREEQGYQHLAMEAFRRGKTLAIKSKLNDETARALNGIARLQTSMGIYDSVLINLTQSRDLDSTKQNKIMTDQAEGRYWQTQNQYDRGLAVLQRALNEATAAKDERNIAILLSSIGSIYFSHNPDMKVALGFFQRSNQYGDSLKPSALVIRNYSRMANSYMVMGDLKKAEAYLRLAKDAANSLEYLSLKAYILSSWSILLAEQGRLRESADFLEEPIRIKRTLGDYRQLQNDLLNLAETRISLRQFKEARILLNEGASIGHRLNDIVFLKYFYNALASLDTATGNYKSAYLNFKKSMMYKDSSFSVEHLRSVNEIKEKYEAEQKEKIIAEKELQIKEQKYQRAIILGVAITATLIMTVVLILIRNKSRAKLQEERELRLQTIVKAQEDVQQRIARDLHDGLVQVLGAAQMSLESVSEDSNPELLKKQIRVASGIMEEAVMEARSISHQVLPYSLLKGGLIEAIEELLNRNFDKYEFRKPSTELAVSESESIHIFRIVQELVNNVRKHAEASQVVFSIMVNEKELTLIFEDDGRGITLNGQSTGMGLSNIKTRAEIMKGNISIQPAIPKGTVVTLRIPR